jgi:hypothetical protein
MNTSIDSCAPSGFPVVFQWLRSAARPQSYGHKIMQMNFYLFTCKLNDPKANNKVCTNKEKRAKGTQTKYKNNTSYIIIRLNSILICLRHNLTAQVSTSKQKKQNIRKQNTETRQFI